MAMQHTPGPWRFEYLGDESRALFIDASKGRIAEVLFDAKSNDAPYVECEANAKLMAASPDMAVMLCEIRKQLDRTQTSRGLVKSGQLTQGEFVNLMRDMFDECPALAKAGL